MTDDVPEQIGVRCVLMRGGTSKALFFHEADVPPPGPARDRFLVRIMGTPDVMQIDGLGGSHLVTSKVAIIRRSTRPDADVDYTFVQVDVDRDIVATDANCGNISAAVAPFAIDEGLVDVSGTTATVRIWNTNTGKMLVSRLPVSYGKARVQGDCAIAGVPGTGAEILLDYADVVGARTGKLLPTGRAVDSIGLEDGRVIQATIADVGNPVVFVQASEIGLTGDELPPAINADRALIETMGEIQSKAGQMIGMWSDWRTQHLPALPALVAVAGPGSYVGSDGVTYPADAMDLRARFVFLGKCHTSMAGAGSMCTAAASRVSGSVVQRVIAAADVVGDTLRIGHPLGVMKVEVSVDGIPADPAETRFRTLGFARTARRLMEGTAYVPNEAAMTHRTPVVA